MTIPPPEEGFTELGCCWLLVAIEDGGGAPGMLAGGTPGIGGPCIAGVGPLIWGAGPRIPGGGPLGPCCIPGCGGGVIIGLMFPIGWG